MEKNSFISNSKKLPKGFLITLVFILSFEIFNAYLDNYFYTPARRFDGLKIKTKNEIALSKEQSFDILILGDSHTYCGVIPKTIEERTGYSCFNLSLFGPQMLIGSYIIFKNYIEQHPVKPKYVVISFDLFSAYPKTKSSYAKFAVSDLADLKKGGSIEFIKEFGIVQGIKFLIPSLKHQGRFRSFAENPFSFELPSKTQINNIIKQIYLDKGYYFPVEMLNKLYKKNRPEYSLFFVQNDLNNFSISPFSLKYLRRILELARENNIKPIYNIQVMPPSVYNRFKEYPYLKLHEDFIVSLRKDFPDLIVLNVQHILNRDELFFDMDHLSGEGAVLLSEFFSQKINELKENQ